MAPRKTPKTETPKEEQVETPKEPKQYDWRDPEATFADDDESLDARMWRMAQR